LSIRHWLAPFPDKILCVRYPAKKVPFRLR
jgi:hypothetical protein